MFNYCEEMCNNFSQLDRKKNNVIINRIVTEINKYMILSQSGKTGP